jgi:hypothetical protein
MTGRFDLHLRLLERENARIFADCVPDDGGAAEGFRPPKGRC